MSVNDENDLKGIETASKVAKHLRNFLREKCESGITTRYLDELCEKEMTAIGARSAPKMFYDAPSYSFYSVNNCIVHGLPSDTYLQDGDILKIDVTPFYEGFISDTACSVIIGGNEKNSTAEMMISNTISSFEKALKQCRANRKLNEIGRAIETNTQKQGFFVIRELSGHGVGRAVHEDPSVLNYYDKDEPWRLREGLVIAIEPMIANRKGEVRTKRDGWTIYAKNGSLTAHYEHTVLITDNDPIVLTA